MADVHYGAIIRPDTTNGWALLDDADHTPAGIASITITEEYVRFNFTTPLVDIYSYSVAVDEILLKEKYRAAISCTTTYAEIRLQKDNSTNVYRGYTNLEFLGRKLETGSLSSIIVQVYGAT